MQTPSTGAAVAPFTVRPRLDRKPWGGNRLADFGHRLADDGETGGEPLGEVLVTAGESVITSGPHAGTALGELVRSDPDGVAGPAGLRATGGRPLFPLLIKLIDAGQHLSIQVHPGDEQAAATDELGKTEAWHVLEAAGDGTLFLGLEDVDVDGFFRDCVTGDGSSSGRLIRHRAVPGQSVTIPAGTVHALGAGVVVYEVQQPSEITYRLDDWGRVGPDGQPRPRHLEAGRHATRPELRPVPGPGTPVDDPDGGRKLLAETRYFALERLAPSTGQSMIAAATDSAQVLTVIAGTARIAELSIGLGESVVVPAASGSIDVTGDDAVVLRAWVPGT
ncbi:MAG TPA: type I phosphomannose isomerase catalytic subunit [Thermomicrobiales bacterium]|jgi:mannose-6-phosphate isomerase|nr:type I phosphomannose isomerase catalytic subunit [Thermomicrobiales bacterium]